MEVSKRARDDSSSTEEPSTRSPNSRLEAQRTTPKTLGRTLARMKVPKNTFANNSKATEVHTLRLPEQSYYFSDIDKSNSNMNSSTANTDSKMKANRFERSWLDSDFRKPLPGFHESADTTGQDSQEKDQASGKSHLHDAENAISAPMRALECVVKEKCSSVHLTLKQLKEISRKLERNRDDLTAEVQKATATLQDMHQHIEEALSS